MGNKSSKPDSGATTKPMVISLEGNIGTGKTTFFEELRKHYHNDPTICFLQEPIEDWNAVKDMDGIPMLVNFYQNPKK